MTATATLTAVDLLHGLVAIPSVSDDEAYATSWLCDEMAAMGYAASIDGAGNVVGTRGTGAHHVLLLGHIDTVPGDIPVRISDGVLHGRGAVDAKGPLAAFVVAGAQATLPPDTRLTVIGAAGEETYGSPGATFLAQQYPAPDLVIIGEPSGWDGLVLGYKGSLGLTAMVTCAMSHSAGPQATAPERAIAFWNRLQAWLVQHNGDTTAAFEVLDATLRHMDSTSDGLFGRSTLEMTFRLPPGTSSAWVREQVALLAEDMDLAWRTNAEGYRTDKRSPLVAPFLSAIRAAGGTPRLKVKTGTSDMNVVAPFWNCPMVAYGPGDSRFDHTPEEQISLEEFERGIAVLTRAIESLTTERMARKVAS